jgi:hypothetical protein
VHARRAPRRLGGWRAQREAEIARYAPAARHSGEAAARMIEEFLVAERGHEETLGGKWMGA